MEIKIPLYNILNMFLTGLVFIGGCIIIYPKYALEVLNSEIIKNLGIGPEIVSTVCVFALAYEIGLIINRIGSVIIESAFKKVKLIPFDDDYIKFNKKKKEYPIMSTLSREYALSRTGIALFLILLVLSVATSNCPFAIACGVITVVYYFSCKKHAKKIVALMQSNNPTEE